jgi:hypothetical protein
MTQIAGYTTPPDPPGYTDADDGWWKDIQAKADGYVERIKAVLNEAEVDEPSANRLIEICRESIEQALAVAAGVE